jgi:hypothetical protein
MLFKVEIMEFDKKKNDYYIKYNFWSIHVEQPRQQIIVRDFFNTFNFYRHFHPYCYRNVSEYRRGNQKWKIQKNGQHRVHKTKTNKTKTLLNMCWATHIT